MTPRSRKMTFRWPKKTTPYFFVISIKFWTRETLVTIINTRFPRNYIRPYTTRFLFNLMQSVFNKDQVIIIKWARMFWEKVGKITFPLILSAVLMTSPIRTLFGSCDLRSWPIPVFPSCLQKFCWLSWCA